MEITLGGSHTFTQNFYDENGTLADPSSVSFRVYRVISTPTFGPYSYDGDEGQIERTGPGMYQVTIGIHPHMMPGFYTAEWSAVVYSSEENILTGGDATTTEFDATFQGGDALSTTFETEIDSGDSESIYTGSNVIYERTQFQVVESTPESSTILDPPRVYGTINLSLPYNDMGDQLTALCIVGHCSGLSINEPYQVDNLEEAKSIMGGNPDSPMIRYMLEAYNAGARNIWLMPSAPEAEYIPWDSTDITERFIPRPEFNGRNFYEQYEVRYLETMSALAEHEFADIVVAPDAPFYYTGGIDFLTPLLDSCVGAFLNTGRFRFGFIGTLLGTGYTDEDLDNIENDARLNQFGPDGKTMAVFFGEGTINTPHIHMGYSHSCVNIAAATAAANPMETGLTYQNLKGVVSPIGKPLSKDRIRSLANAKVNPIIRTTRAKRGEPYNTIVASDNLLAQDGSDYWALPQMKIVQEVIKVVRSLSLRRIGTIQRREYKRDVTDYLTRLVVENRIRDYTLSFNESDDIYKMTVDIVIKPYFGVREIFFSVGLQNLERTVSTV